jgi:outer membrane protein assembly factor BamD (BamD/ComL family)
VDNHHGRRHGQAGKDAGRRRVGARLRRAACLFTCSFLLGAGGCVWDGLGIAKPPPAPPPADSMVLRGDRLEADKPTGDEKVAANLAGAHELYRRGEYAKARKIFRSIADNQKNPPAIAEEARYYQAECLRLEGYYTDAADWYSKQLQDFPNGTYREQAVQRLYDISNYWLDDTRKEMTQVKEQREGKRWFVDQNFLHWDKTKPLLDEEGNAVEKLEQVHLNDMTGPMAEKALFLMGSVKFFDEDYREADHYFTELVEMHPNSPMAPQAVELGIISKHMSTGGSDYDGRKVAEARRLVHTALNKYPELASQKNEFLQRQLVGITLQQAEKDYKVAEFYRRTGHPESAYFCYEVVRRRYPGTKFFDLATEHMNQLRSQAEKSHKAVPVVPSPGGGSSAAGAPGLLPVPGQPLMRETTPMPRPVTPEPEVAPPPRPLPGLN